jgi:hypothetical protein
LRAMTVFLAISWRPAAWAQSTPLCALADARVTPEKEHLV